MVSKAMTARFPFTVEYIVKCAACHVEHRETHDMLTHDEFPVPYPPGWHFLDNAPYCPKHYLAFTVDGNTWRIS